LMTTILMVAIVSGLFIRLEIIPTNTVLQGN